MTLREAHPNVPCRTLPCSKHLADLEFAGHVVSALAGNPKYNLTGGGILSLRSFRQQTTGQHLPCAVEIFKNQQLEDLVWLKRIRCT